MVTKLSSSQRRLRIDASSLTGNKENGLGSKNVHNTWALGLCYMWAARSKGLRDLGRLRTWLAP